MSLSKIRPTSGSTKAKKRRGKGSATGLGGTAGRGHKGKKARTGGKIPSWFEGGQMPLQRRLPKRGFKNINRIDYQVLNVGQLADIAANTVIDRAWLKREGLVRRRGPVKLLAKGEIKVPLTVKVDAASAAAARAIEAAGGRVEVAAPKA